MTPFQTLLFVFVEIWVLSYLSLQAQKILTVVITKDPSSVNTCANRTVNFTCAAIHADTFLWFLNDSYVQELTNLEPEVDPIPTTNSRSSILFLTIPEEFGDLNESNITCKALNLEHHDAFSPVAKSSKALLRIQGPLDPADDLNAAKDCSEKSINLSWTRPYTLEGIEIPLYNICIDGNCSHCSGDLNHTVLPLPAYNEDFSEVHEICIKASGCTNNSATEFECVNISLIEGPRWIPHERIKPTLNYNMSTNLFQAMLIIDIEGDNTCPLPTDYCVELVYSNGKKTSVCPTAKKQSTLVTIEIAFIEKESNVSVTVMSNNSAGSNSSDSLQFALFHVQNAILDESTITCTFVNGSNAEGCCISLICANATSNNPCLDVCKVNKGSQSSTATGSIVCSGASLNCSSYDVYVYDILFDETVSQQPAYVLWNVTISPSTSDTSHFDLAHLGFITFAIIPIVLAVFMVICHCHKIRKKTAKHPMQHPDDGIQGNKESEEQESANL